MRGFRLIAIYIFILLVFPRHAVAEKQAENYVSELSDKAEAMCNTNPKQSAAYALKAVQTAWKIKDDRLTSETSYVYSLSLYFCNDQKNSLAAAMGALNHCQNGDKVLQVKIKTLIGIIFCNRNMPSKAEEYIYRKLKKQLQE